VVEVETIRSVNGTLSLEANIRYVLSSRDAGDPVLKDAARLHWAIENSLHRDVDVGYSM
jgi:predicted transposase YbfD/YdcC